MDNTHTNNDKKIKNTLDETMKVEATFMDLSNTFNILTQRLLLAKLKASGLQLTDLTSHYVSDAYTSW